jgi:hypothetical protein
VSRAGRIVGGLVAFAAVVFGAVSTAQEPRTPVQEFREPRPVPREDLRVLAPGGPYAARQLVDQGWCSTDEPGLPVARLSWALPKQRGAFQRVDVTMFRDGFETGRFLTFSELKGDDNELLWRGLEPGINYSWRVLILTGDGWLPSATGRAQGPICPADRPEPREPR